MKETILVVEDDEMIRNLIRIYLEKNEYHVIEAKDGMEAKELFLQFHPCLIVLDLMLPKLSGEEFCAWVHEEQGAEVSIIMLSAKSRIDDKVTGLRMGADSYMTKPFDPDELIAQVEAVLRRTGQFCQKLVSNGLCLMPRKGEVLLYQEKIHMTKHEFQLLYFFMQHPGVVFSREQLIEEIYPTEQQAILDRTIDAHIKKIREKIEDVPARPTRIQTVRGMGYKFVATK